MQLEQRWVDLQPLTVKVNGNMAVIQFYGYWSEMRGEERVITEAKRTEVFERVGGRWRLSVGHAEPTPFAGG